MKTPTKRRIFGTALIIVGLSASALTSGCHEDAMVKNLQIDDSYIRLPDKLSDGSVRPGAGDPFPLHAGNQWTMQVSGLEHPSLEKIADIGPTTVNGHSGEILEVNSGNGKPRQEIYANSGTAIDLLASGLHGEMMQMSPPIPLFHLPLKQGDTIAWDGILHFKTMSSAASALSRVTGAVSVNTPVGKFNAYRIDTMISTMVDGQSAAFPMTRWVAPGVGVVQARVLVGKTAALKQLQSYHVNGKN